MEKKTEREKCCECNRDVVENMLGDISNTVNMKEN